VLFIKAISRFPLVISASLATTPALASDHTRSLDLDNHGRKAGEAEYQGDRRAMTPMDQLHHAVEIASRAHDGQTDKIGMPYFEHCKRVAALVPCDDARTVAYLHDVVEKGKGWTFDRLAEEGFSREIVLAVDALTNRSEEKIEEFVTRAAANPLAVVVKQADLEDNLWQAERTGADPQKYHHEMDILRTVLSKNP
jgi:(p)ppGpp synthase/HD superfamily hydrolase